MQEIFYIFAKTVSIALDVVSIAMLVRMILSFFTPDPMENRLYIISCYVTEPFIAPVRAIMVHFNIGQDSPIDWAFFATSILLGIIGSILPVI
ncbi:MAG: YggT family protein [Clostridia bacterium]|nr:YggT family protein [Clostridia bacterium]